MKKSIDVIFLLSLLYSIGSHAQTVAISADKMNTVYIGIENPLTITAEGYNCDQLVVSCDGADLKKEGCQYFLRVSREGILELAIRARTAKGLKGIGVHKLRVKLLRNLTANVAGKSGGVLSLAVFKVQRGLSISSGDDVLMHGFVAQKFHIAFIRGSITLFSEENQGALFSAEVVRQMSLLKAGDKVVISNIMIMSPDSHARNLGSITFMLN